MIHEDDLRRLLADAAESVPAPGRAPEALFAEVAQPAVRPAGRRVPTRLKVASIAAAVVAMVAIGATLTRDEGDPAFTATGRAIGPESSTTIPEGGGPKDLVETAEGVPRGPEALASAELDTNYTAVAGGGGANASTPAQAGPPADSARIIRTGSLDLEVRKGAFDGTVARIVSQTIGLGGYVAESTTSESGDAPSGSIVVRVPGDSFETLLADLRKLGEVQAVSSKGTDVTAQFTDLGARLTALQATRDRLSTVLNEAENVPDILSVQDRITAVQIEIETVQGQQKLLEDQTAFATLAVTLGEPGAEIVEVEATDPDDGLGGAWDDARRRFGDSIETLVSWSGSAAVVLIVGLLLLALSRVAWIGLRRRLV